MKVRFKPSDMFEVEVEGETHVALWEKMSEIGEVFAFSCCGACGSKNIRPITRESKYVDEKSGKEKVAKYHELACQEVGCRAKLAFGQHQEGGTMYPQRKDKSDPSGKTYLPNNGWVKFSGKKD